MRNQFQISTIEEQLELTSPFLGWPQSVLLLRQIKSWYGDAVNVAVLGSASYTFDQTGNMENVCKHFGRMLRRLPNICLLTGGMPAVGQDTGAAFAGETPLECPLVHVLPRRYGDGMIPETGRVLTYGEQFVDRQRILGMSAKIAVLIGGGPGAIRESNIVLKCGGVVLPIGCTGGAAAQQAFEVIDEMEQRLDFDLAHEQALAAGVNRYHWEDLTSPDGDPNMAARCVMQSIKQLSAVGAV